MVPQLVLFIGNEFDKLLLETQNYIEAYIKDKENIKLYKVLLDEMDTLSISSGSTVSIFNKESLKDELDELYQQINSIHKTQKQLTCPLNITLISSPIKNKENTAVTTLLHQSVTKLYINKKYPISFSCLFITKQVYRIINKGESTNTLYSGEDLDEIKNKFKESPFTSNIVLLDNQNTKGKGLDFNLSILSKVLSEYFAALATNQSKIFSAWKPLVYTFSLSSLFYDLPWVKQYIQAKLYLTDIENNQLSIRKDNFNKNEEKSKEIVLDLTNTISSLSQQLYTDLNILKNTKNYTKDQINDHKNKTLKNFDQSLLLKSLNDFIANDSVILSDKIKVLEIALGKYNLPEGYQMTNTLDLFLYQFINKYSFVIPDCYIPSYLDILDKKQNADEEYFKLKNFFLHQEYNNIDIQNKQEEIEESIIEIQNIIIKHKDQNNSLSFWFSKLFNGEKYKKYITEKNEYENQINELEEELNQLDLIDSIDCYILIFNLIHDLVFDKLNTLYEIQNGVDSIRKQSLYFINKSKASHTLFNSLEDWVEFNEIVNKPIAKISNQLLLNPEFTCYDFFDFWDSKIAQNKKIIYNNYLSHIKDLKNWLIDTISNNNLPDEKNRLLSSVFELNLFPFIHMTRHNTELSKKASFLILNFDENIDDEQIKLQSLLQKYTNSQPTICYTSNRYKALAIIFHEILDINLCTAFTEKENDNDKT